MYHVYFLNHYFKQSDVIQNPAMKMQFAKTWRLLILVLVALALLVMVTLFKV